MSDPTADGNQLVTDAERDVTDAEWAERLSPVEYRILRECGTEPADSSDR